MRRWQKRENEETENKTHRENEREKSHASATALALSVPSSAEVEEAVTRRVSKSGAVPDSNCGTSSKRGAVKITLPKN